MVRDVLDPAEDTLAEMCWCGHDYTHHTDSDTPVCVHPNKPDEYEMGDPEWTEYDCECDGWYPMDEDPPHDDQCESFQPYPGVDSPCRCIERRGRE